MKNENDVVPVLPVLPILCRIRWFQRLAILSVILMGWGPSAFGNGVVAEWDILGTRGDTLPDLSGSGHDGLMYNIVVTDTGLLFNGQTCRISVDDTPKLALTGSMTIETRIFVHGFSKPTGGSHHGFILFRGDDRGANDPYFLATEPNGSVRFHVENTSGRSAIETPIAKNRWVHVVATLEASNGRQRIYLDGELKKDSVTSIRPMAQLSSAEFPGVGIGNHGGYPETEKYKFPFEGVMGELRLLDTAMNDAQVRERFQTPSGIRSGRQGGAGGQSGGQWFANRSHCALGRSLEAMSQHGDMTK